MKEFWENCKLAATLIALLGLGLLTVVGYLTGKVILYLIVVGGVALVLIRDPPPH